MHKFDFHITDFVSATQHLNCEEVGAYLRLLMHYYEIESPIPNDVKRLFRRLRILPDMGRSLLEEFFIETPDGWRHVRIDAEIELVHKRSEKAAESARRKWELHRRKAELMQSDATAVQPDATAVQNDATPMPVPVPEPVPVPKDKQPPAAPEISDEISGGNGVNRCPYQKIVELYHEVLPELPQVQALTDKRKGFIRQRWLNDMPELEHWRNFFEYVSRSDFLMGRSSRQATDDRPPFRADLEWLTRPNNFVKIAEDRYHAERH